MVNSDQPKSFSEQVREHIPEGTPSWGMVFVKSVLYLFSAFGIFVFLFLLMFMISGPSPSY